MIYKIPNISANLDLNESLENIEKKEHCKPKILRINPLFFIYNHVRNKLKITLIIINVFIERQRIFQLITH